VTGRWFSPGIPVSSTNKTDCHDITEKLLKVVLNTINQIKPFLKELLPFLTFSIDKSRWGLEIFVFVSKIFFIL
jgi:hypothetical protein